MDNTLYVGLSRQLTLQRSLDITANNLANVDTTGFKVESLTVRTDPAIPSGAATSDPINYVIDDNVARNFSQGGIERTGNPTDVAIEGEGFFTVQTAAGPRYTRDGSFTISPQNQLTDSAGDPVLSTGGAPITLDPTKPTLNISKDGTVSQTDPVSASVTVVGKIGVARFPDLSVLTKQGANLYDAPGVTPTAATNARVMQGAVERSNVNPVLEITHLIDIQRAYERVSQMISSTQDLSDSAVQRLGKAA
jgi:flagellar basal-body rod protein FlgF